MRVMMAALVATLISLVVSSMSRNVKMLKKIWVGLSLVTSHTCWAADIYAPETNQLSISSVEVAGSTYNNVVVTVGTVIRVDGAYQTVQQMSITLQKIYFQFHP